MLFIIVIMVKGVISHVFFCVSFSGMVSALPLLVLFFV